MAELLLGALLPMLFESLASHVLLNFVNREKIGDIVKKWETKLKSISKLLDDAEDKAMRGDETVQLWLDDLRDLVYDIEDLVDEFVTQEGIRRFSTETTSKVRSLLPRKLILDHKLRRRMNKISGRLDSFLKQKRDLELNESGGSMSPTSIRMSDSLPQRNVVGREKDENTILAKLLTETDDRQLSVITIVGMGGVGKTTLAKCVFNNPAVVESFPVRGWVCVSDNFDMVEIARALLGSLTGGGCNVDHSSDLNVLHNKLLEILCKEKFLIVLDDYWSEDYNNWERLHNLYSFGMKGSKIIVTTRLGSVASFMQTDPAHRLLKLSDGECLSLLAYHALGVTTFDDHTHLKSVSREIAVKCKGLPLVAKALGGLLRSKPKIAREWEEIRDSKIWNLPHGKDDVLLAFKLSYIHLPSHLKRCFVFCAIFPRDYEFDRDELVLLWMAEGLVKMKCDNSRKSVVCQGRKQFDELLNRSFFQHSTQDESRFVMHDLMNDLAVSIGGTSCLRVDDKLDDIPDVEYRSPKKVRHLLYSSKSSDVDAKFGKCHVLTGLRTFLASNRGFTSHLSEKVLEELLQKLQYLRVLSLREYSIAKIPNCIGHLKHLRYLSFSGSSLIRELPESICTLYNLETLIVKGCFVLTHLPSGMHKLINLRCLDIRGTNALKKMPVGLVQLDKLEILPKFIVGREDGSRLNVLGSLPNLQGDLSILDLQKVENVGDARDAELHAKTGLTALTLVWNDDSNSRNAAMEEQSLRFLQPHQEINELEIYGYRGINFPSWIGSPLLSNMKIVRLRLCATVTTLPSFGLLPCLRELEIQGMGAVCTVGSEFYGNVKKPFRCLEILNFIGMPAWEVWSCDKEIEEPFPRLSKLYLQRCPKLVSNLPHRLSSLVDLRIHDCPLLEASPCMSDLLSLQKLDLRSCNPRLLAKISSANPNALMNICLERIHKLLYLNKHIASSLSAAKSLIVRDCDGLIRLWEDNVFSEVASFTHLKYLSIIRCVNLQKLPNNMQSMTSLRELIIDGCPKLTTLPDGIMMSCSLEKLHVERCGSLTFSLEGANLLTTLISLKISDCGRSERLQEGTIISHNSECSSEAKGKQGMQVLGPTSLKKLWILRSEVALGCLLEDSNENEQSNYQCPLLEEIHIGECNIKSITRNLHMFTSLTKLSLSKCPDLEADMFPQLPSCLKSLTLEECNKVKSLPHQMHTTSTSLQVLSLCRLSIESFPKGGLPLNLEVLVVANCKYLTQPMEEWGLHKLTALKELRIFDEIGCLRGMSCFPPPSPNLASDWLIFPSNLENLEIRNQPDMVRLSDGIRNHLTSLRRLHLYRCRKIRFLPNEGFPPSLGYLRIKGCSGDIENRCSMKGEYFHLIRSIPDFGF